MSISEAEMNELRMGALTAIDGLWFLAAEKKLGFETALELDLDVWRSYGPVMLKRVAKLMGITIGPDEPVDMATLNAVTEILCEVDGTECSSEVTDENTSVFKIHRCSWYENLKSAGRDDVIPCEMIDKEIYGHWLAHIDPSLEMEITHSIPQGDDYCGWILRRRPPPPS